ncbi:MAG: hypothetical protein IJM62_05570, partial [Lachnospiraceae bacterium]|nr:hypothetical protein [Lachnospiraceae bacterium]
DDEGILHKQMPATVDRSSIIGDIVTLAGMAVNEPSVMGSGTLATAKTEFYSEFSKVKKITVKPERDLVKLKGMLRSNMIYVCKEDMGFVRAYIESRVKH